LVKQKSVGIGNKEIAGEKNRTSFKIRKKTCVVGVSRLLK
jgi:hypothetical protein